MACRILLVLLIGISGLCDAEGGVGISTTESLEVDITSLWTAPSTPHPSVLYVNDRHSVVFSVKACGEVHVVLRQHGEEHLDDDHVTTVIIGGDHNSVTYVHRGDIHYYRAHTPEILHCAEFRSFWISWKYWYLEVGVGLTIGNNAIPVQPIDDNFPMMISLFDRLTSVAFSTGEGYSGEWRIKENQGLYMHSHTPGDSHYDHIWKTVERRDGYYSVMVRAQGEVRVALATVQGLPAYEVVIGGDGNQLSCIQRAFPEEVLACQNTSDILDPVEYRDFWIGWQDSELHLGIGPYFYYDAVVNYTDYDFPGVTAVSFSAVPDSGADWILDEHSGSRYTFHSDRNFHNYAHGDVNNFILTPKQDRLIFSVHGCQDAVIALCQDPAAADADFTYFIHIGSSDNSKTILYLPFSPQFVEVDTPDIISCRSMRTFLVSWVGTRIRLGKMGTGVDTELILDYDTGMEHFVNSVGFANAWAVGDVYWEVANTEGDGFSAETATEHNDYNQLWLTVPQESFKAFRVRACENAHVLLAEKHFASSAACEVVLGASGNTETVIRERAGAVDNVASAVTPDLLSCNNFRTFWVSWLERSVRVGRGQRYGYQQLVAMDTQMAHDVTSISITTEGAEGIWEFENNRGGHYWSRTTETSIEWMMLQPGTEWMYFSLAGSGPASLTLTPKYRDSSRIYQIVIGERENKETWLVKDWNIMLKPYSTGGIMSLDDLKDFWVSWVDQKIVFGTGRYRNRQQVFSYDFQDYSDELFDVGGVGISAAESIGGDMQWKLFTENGVELSHATQGVHSNEQFSLDVSHTGHLVFGLTACGSATLFLSAIPHFEESAYSYTILLQGTDNFTTISKGNDDETSLVKSLTPYLLSCNEERYFWVSWQPGYVALGSGKTLGVTPVLAYQDMTMSFPVKAVGISTDGWTGNWRFPLADEDFQDMDAGDNTPESTGLSAGEIFGIVIGVLLLCMLLVIIAYVIYKPPEFLRREQASDAVGFDNPIHDHPMETSAQTVEGSGGQ